MSVYQSVASRWLLLVDGTNTIHSFIQRLHYEYLLCVKHCAGLWYRMNKIDMVPAPSSSPELSRGNECR